MSKSREEERGSRSREERSKASMPTQYKEEKFGDHGKLPKRAVGSDVEQLDNRII